MKKALLFTAFTLLMLVGYSQVTNGLVAKYSFNNGNANDEVGTNDGTVTNATLTADRFGNSNMAYSFDGASAHINLGDAPEFQMGTNDFSISLWVNYSIPQQSFVISKRHGAPTNYSQFNIAVMANPISGGASLNMSHLARSSNTEDRTIAAGDASGAWKHVVWVHDYIGSSSFYLNGQLVSTSSILFTGNFDIAGQPLVLGYSSENLTNYFNGSIDDVRIYNRGLDSNEIVTLFNEPDPLSVGTLEIAKNADAMRIYPNPSTFTLQIMVKQPTMISIENLLGLNLRSPMVHNNAEVDISGLEAGIYILRDLKTGKAIKFIKE